MNRDNIYAVDLYDEHDADVSLLDVYGAYDGDWLSRQTFPPIEYVVPGLIPEGLTYIIAAPKIGKSWLTLDLAISAASGGEFLGSTLTVRPVLMLALEDAPRRMQSRASMLGVRDFPGAVTVVHRVKPADAVPLMREYMAAHEGQSPLVILDTLGKIKPAKSAAVGAYEHDYQVSAALKDVADEYGGAVVVVHHNRKASSDDFLEDVSGTQGIAGAADTIIVIRRARSEVEGELHVTSRDALEGAYAVEFHDGRWTLAGMTLADSSAVLTQRARAKRLDDDSRSIVAVVDGRSADGLQSTAADVAGALGWEDSEAIKKLRTYLARLSDGGHIRRAARGVYESTTTGVVSGVSVVNAEADATAPITPGVVSGVSVVNPSSTETTHTTQTTVPHEGDSVEDTTQTTHTTADDIGAPDADELARRFRKAVSR